MAERNILCFGDSLTWGWVPIADGAPTERYPRNVRWTGVLADRLGPGWHIIEEGLSARTTTADDPTDPRLNGSTYLPSAIASHLPLDLVVIMLGTNDTKTYLNRDSTDIATGMSALVGTTLSSAGGVGTAYPAPRVLVVAPPPLGPLGHPWFDLIFSGGREKTIELTDKYRALADFMSVDFFDAGSVVETGGIDGVHFTEDDNRVLGEALAAEISGLFG